MGWSYRKMYSIPNPKTPIPITKQQNHRSGTAILAFHRKIPSCFLTELGGYQLALFFRGNEHHQPVNSLGLNITAETQNLASEEWEGQETSGNRDRVRTFSLSWKYQVRGRNYSTPKASSRKKEPATLWELLSLRKGEWELLTFPTAPRRHCLGSLSHPHVLNPFSSAHTLHSQRNWCYPERTLWFKPQRQWEGF